MRHMHKLYLFDEYEHLSEEFILHALQFLPENRRIRAMRYRRTIDRWNCVITYLMLQYGLREYFGITPFEIAFGKYGKPYLSQFPDVHFNISHCDTGCAVVVADCSVGVDIQDIRPFSWKVAKRVCCERELIELEDSADRDKLFTMMWTMKECYGKVAGTGILNKRFKIDNNLVNVTTKIDTGIFHLYSTQGHEISKLLCVISKAITGNLKIYGLIM